MLNLFKYIWYFLKKFLVHLIQAKYLLLKENLKKKLSDLMAIHPNTYGPYQGFWGIIDIFCEALFIIL